jgi:hypothetical protein
VKPFRADFYPLNKISDIDIKQMHKVFVKYYNNADYAIFSRDIKKKEGSIILKRIDNGEIVGFSTIALIDDKINGKRRIGIYSGDTVIEMDYWGTPKLQMAFISYLYKIRVKYPTASVYWFLISKGYKTYLLLANNMPFYYPRYDKIKDVKRQTLVKDFSNFMYDGYFDENTGLLKFGENYQKLKEDVAEITDEMKIKYPKIDFFEKVNPTWREGTELPCIADISWLAMLLLPVPFVIRKIKNQIFGSKSRAEVKSRKNNDIVTAVNILSAKAAGDKRA